MAKNAFSRLFDYIDEGPGEAVSQWFDRHGDIIERAVDNVPTIMAGLAGTLAGGASTGAIAAKVADAVLNQADPNLRKNPDAFEKAKNTLLNSAAFAGALKKGYDFYQSRNPQAQQQIPQQMQEQMPQNKLAQSLTQLNPQQQVNPETIQNLFSRAKSGDFDAISKLGQFLPEIIKTGAIPFSAYSRGETLGETLFGKPDKMERVSQYGPEEQARIDAIRKYGQEQYLKELQNFNSAYPASGGYQMPSMGNMAQAVRSNPNLSNALYGLAGSGLGALLSGGTMGAAPIIGAGLGGYLSKYGNELRRNFNI